MRRPYSLLMSEDQHLWVADGITQKFLKYDLTGKLLYSWGTFGAFPGGFWGVHQFSVDSEGNLYTADVHVGRPQKFRPKKGANPANLIGAYSAARTDSPTRAGSGDGRRAGSRRPARAAGAADGRRVRSPLSIERGESR